MQCENGAESCLATNHKLNCDQDGWMMDGWKRDRWIHGWVNGRETDRYMDER